MVQSNRPIPEVEDTTGLRIIVAAAWTFVIFTSWGTLVGLTGSPPGATFVFATLSWCPWIPLNWLLWRMTKRFSWGPDNRAGTIGLHLLLSLVWISLYSIYLVSLGTVMRGGGLPLARQIFVERLDFWVFFDWAFYFGLVAAVYAYAHYGQRVEAEHRLLRAERAAQAAEARAQAQLLRPHFLFNTLNGVSGMIRTGERAAAVQLVDSLSDLLRYSLEAGVSGTALVSDEISAVESYLAIQKIRFGDRLSFTIDVDPSTMAYAIPALILQPLVENALTHGGDDVGKPHVRVTGNVAGNVVTLCVANPDPPFGPPLWDENEGHGLGIPTVRAQLEQWSGGAGHLNIQRENGWVTAVVTLPTTVV